MIARCLALALLVIAANAFAQAYPAKPLRLVVGWPPGGAADGVARPLAAKLSDALGRPVVVDNRGGATGTIGASVVAKAPADGYTLLLGTSNEMVLNPYEKMPYNTIEDFAPISMVISFPSTLVVHPSIPVKSVQQFVAFMRARPGKLNFATTGSGTSHLSGEMFKQIAKVDFTYVAYKGGGPAIIDQVAGHVDAGFSTLPAAVPFVRNGKLRALMVTDAKRSPAAPDIPAATEAGLAEHGPHHVERGARARRDAAGGPRPAEQGCRRCHEHARHERAHAHARGGGQDELARRVHAIHSRRSCEVGEARQSVRGEKLRRLDPGGRVSH